MHVCMYVCMYACIPLLVSRHPTHISVPASIASQLSLPFLSTDRLSWECQDTEKLDVPLVFKKFSLFYGKSRVFSFDNKFCYVPYWARWVFSMPFKPVFTPDLILPLPLCLGLPSRLFPSRFATKAKHATSSHACHMIRLSKHPKSIPLNITCIAVMIMKFHIT